MTDLPTHDHAIVIVGAGLAAAHCADSLRSEGFGGRITIVGDEHHAPYERPALSKSYLQGESSADALLVHEQSWYETNDIELRTGTSVEGIDRAAKTLHLDVSTESIPYDILVVATGSRPRRLLIPGADSAWTLRYIEDSDGLRQAFTESANVVVIGAGWIGLEAAAAARAAGLTVTVVEQASLPLASVLGEELGRYFLELHRNHGVTMRMSSAVHEIISADGRVQGVRVDDEVVPADLVVMGVGAAPDVRLADESGLSTANGIVVDERFRTSDPAIYAIGDVATAHNTAVGTTLRVEHWDNAVRQGDALGKILMGADVEYNWSPYFFSDQFDLGMEYVGRAGTDDESIVRGDLTSGEFIAFWLAGTRVTAAMNVNIWDVSDTLRTLIGRDVDPSRLRDLSVPLSEVIA
ncbi:FAD-dependent oxidoreductase [Aeromicrobium sp.]|uniref:NAD(P)/FAD-dependent oxidoreductase n=1 Tax=Aeromicrobium sp. TaxID=1871063 RepID=UPI00199C58DE|nr:FAD-dependent oxidoreductase [Aeromicrobium sp.]MBC7631403.1 FAD-dependent oxidoreductase [Aeromicrobium sp.]